MSSAAQTPTPVPAVSASNASTVTTPTTTSITPTSPTSPTSTPTAAAAAVAGGGGSANFSSMADFKAKAPVVYKAMMQSIAMNICNDSQDWSNLIVEAMQEGADNNP